MRPIHHLRPSTLGKSVLEIANKHEILPLSMEKRSMQLALGGVGSSSVRTPFLMNAGTYGDDAFVAEGTGQTGALSPLPLPLPLAIALV